MESTLLHNCLYVGYESIMRDDARKNQHFRSMADNPAPRVLPECFEFKMIERQRTETRGLIMPPDPAPGFRLPEGT